MLNEWHYCSHAQHEEARDSQTCDRSIVNVEQTTRTEMTSAPVSDDSIFLHESVIRGHHIFKGILTPRTGEIVQVRQEAGNPHDRNAVALLKSNGMVVGGTVVGHVPSSFLLGSLGQQSLLTLLGP